MFKKVISSIICMTMIAGVMVGCGSKNEAGTVSTSTVTVQATTSTVEEAKPVTLNILKADAQQAPVWDELAKEYNKQNPNVTLNIQSIDSDMWSVLKTKLNAGDPPDVFILQGYNYMNIYKDYLLDLTNEPFVKNINESDLLPATVDGKILGVPLQTDAYALIYNKKMFADAGITELPKTLSELEKACEKLKAKGYTPFSNGYKEFWVFKHLMVHYMSQEAGEPAAIAAELNKGTKTFADLPLTSKFFDYLDLSMKYAAPKSLETGFQEQLNAIANGEVAMTAQGNWAEEAILKINPELEMGFLPVPVLEDPSMAKIMAGPFWQYVLAKDGKNIEASKALMNWIITSDYGKSFIPQKLKMNSAVKGAEFPNTQLAAEAKKFIEAKATLPIVQLLWPDGYEQKQGDAFQKYIAGKITREECLTEMTAQWAKLAK